VYEIKVYDRFPSAERAFFPENRRVEFTRAEDAQDLELPNAALLDCHYRVAEILNASGMAEVIERYRRDYEDIKGNAGGSLKEDGGTDIGRCLVGTCRGLKYNTLTCVGGLLIKARAFLSFLCFLD
jgi:hypothetical protein